MGQVRFICHQVTTLWRCWVLQWSVVSAYSSLTLGCKVCGPQGWEFDTKWRSRGVEIDILKTLKCQISHGLPAPPILMQTIHRCMRQQCICWKAIFAWQHITNLHSVKTCAISQVLHLHHITLYEKIPFSVALMTLLITLTPSLVKTSLKKLRYKVLN